MWSECDTVKYCVKKNEGAIRKKEFRERRNQQSERPKRTRMLKFLLIFNIYCSSIVDA